MKNEINVGNILRGEDSLHVCPLLIFNWINVAYFLHPYWNLSDMQKWFMCHVVYLLISHWRQKEIHDKTIPLIPPRLAIPLNILLLVLLFFIGFVPYIRRQIRIILTLQTLDIYIYNTYTYIDIDITATMPFWKFNLSYWYTKITKELHLFDFQNCCNRW